MQTRMIARFILIAALAGSGVGCSSYETAKMAVTDVTTATRMTPPADHERIIGEYFQRTLKDPDSLRLRNWTGPVADSEDRMEVIYPSSFLGPGKAVRHKEEFWTVTVEANAKNSYGGYTGYHLFVFRFRGNDLLSAVDRTQEQEDAREAMRRILSR